MHFAPSETGARAFSLSVINMQVMIVCAYVRFILVVYTLMTLTLAVLKRPEKRHYLNTSRVQLHAAAGDASGRRRRRNWRSSAVLNVGPTVTVHAVRMSSRVILRARFNCRRDNCICEAKQLSLPFLQKHNYCDVK